MIFPNSLDTEHKMPIMATETPKIEWEIDGKIDQPPSKSPAWMP